MPSVNVLEFNSSNTEDRLQIDSTRGALKVYTGGGVATGWQTLIPGAVGPGSVDEALAGTTTPLVAENVPLNTCLSDVSAALTTQVMLSTAIKLVKGQVVTKIGFLSGATAANTPTNQWAALYDTSATPALIGQSTDTLTAAWALDTLNFYTLASAYTVPTTGTYYAALMVKATAVPSLICSVAPRAAANGSLQAGGKVRSQTSGAALTGTAPGTIATPTTVVNTPWVAVV